MYKITWDKETGGVLLNSRVVDGTLGTSPRPVFWEELDLLGLNLKGWNYPHSEAPLLWAVNKQYYYHGELCFEAKGANIYDPAQIIMQAGKERMSLRPVNVKKMLDRCQEFMFLLESEAIEFIRDTYNQYVGARKSVEDVSANQLDYDLLVQRMEKKSKQKMAIVREDCNSFDIMPLETAQAAGKKVYQTTKIDKFLASFSGGKDSQVVLDLCTRAIPSTEFEVIYSDTGYELPPSLELYKTVQKHYHEKFPDLKFSMAKNHESVLHYWDKIGTPSDKHRWCCSVMKTAPLYRSLKVDGNKQAKALAFEGVRSEESTMRSNYERIGKGVKHDSVINARPILNWNTTEVFIYLFSHNLTINQAYRLGKPRVGCLICPFSSPWDDMIVNTRYKKELEPFLSRLVEWSRKRHIPNIDEYIKEHKWKLRASGNSVGSKTKVVFLKLFPTFIVHVSNAKKSIETWLPVLCDYSISSKSEDKVVGELKYDKKIYSFDIFKKDKNNYTFTLHEVNDAQLVSLMKRIIFKSAYCINCEGCEVECPTGALSVYPKISIDKHKCIHCYKCLQFHDNGCIVANSLIMNTETNAKGGSISRIGTFGIHEEWLQEYLADPEGFWAVNCLGNKQEQSFKAWLLDANIINPQKQITSFGEFLKDHYEDEPELIWELMWTNYAYGSILCHWFMNTINIGQTFSKSMLDEIALSDFEGSKNTITYAIGGFMQIFNYSPIGNILQQGNNVDGKSYIRSGHSELSSTAFAYSLYKYAEAKNVRSLKVSDFYQDECEIGPAKEFAISKSTFEKILRQLNSASNRILIAELNMGLESITLREDLTSMGVLKQLV